MPISVAVSISIPDTALAPCTVKFAFSFSPALTSFASPIRSRIRYAQTASVLKKKYGRRPKRHGVPIPGDPVREEQDVASFLLNHRPRTFQPEALGSSRTAEPTQTARMQKKLSMHSE